MTEKSCRICGQLKPVSEFYEMAGMADGHRNECKACNLQQKRERYLRDPEVAKARVKKWQHDNAERYNAAQRARRQRPEVKAAERGGHLKRKFGLTSEQYDEMFEHQGGVCWICGEPPAESQALDVDHDHTTGEVRALLCRNCNQGIGKFHENPELLMTAAAYLILGEGSGPDRDRDRQRIRLVLGG